MFPSQQKVSRLSFQGAGECFLRSFSRERRELWVPVLLEVIVVMTGSFRPGAFPQCPQLLASHHQPSALLSLHVEQSVKETSPSSCSKAFQQTFCQTLSFTQLNLRGQWKRGESSLGLPCRAAAWWGLEAMCECSRWALAGSTVMWTLM